MTLEEVLDRYLQEMADGLAPDQEEYLRAHPDLAPALKGLFRTLDFVEATSRSINAAGLEEGQSLGEYRIVREIGRGGMGVVYEAVQTSLDRQVALKVLATGAILSKNAKERFAREAATAGGLHHSNIVPVYTVGEEKGIQFYTMQYIEGRSLSGILKEAGGVPPDSDHFRRVARWGRQAADALAYAHSQGTIHRDIKPSNLLVDGDDNLWITDFGLARVAGHATITVSGDVIGTARYMSPEQVSGGNTPVDERSDIYSLGATLYEMLALAPAFDAESREMILNKIAVTEPTPLRRVNGAIPRDLETIVTRCMARERRDRYATAAAVAEDCRRFAAGEPIRARRTPVYVLFARFLRRHRLATAGVLFLTALMVILLLLFLQIRRGWGEERLEEAFTAALFEHDFAAAAASLDDAASYGADSVRLHLYRALIPLLEKQPRLAFEPLDRALESDPENVEARLAVALAHINNGDVFRGQRKLARIPESTIDTALGWLLHGLAKSKNQRDEAIDSFDRAVALRRDFTPAISARSYYRGFRLQTEGDRDQLEKMLDDCDALVIFRPGSARSYTDRAAGWLSAACYAATQEDLAGERDRWLEACRSDLEKAIELRRADETLPVVQKGLTLRTIGDFEGAIVLFAEAIAIETARDGKANPPLVHKHAMAAYALGDLEAALDEIVPVCEAAPAFFPLALQRALLLAELGRLDEARAVCADCMERQKAFSNAFLPSVAVMELVGGWLEAEAALRAFAGRGSEEIATEDAARERPGPALLYMLGECDGAALLEAAEGVPGPLCEYAFLIGLRELARGNREAGIAAFETCVETGIFRFLEHRYGQVLLERARGDGTWPGWIDSAQR